MEPTWGLLPRLSVVEAIRTPQGFQSPSDQMAPCRKIRHFLDRSSTVAVLLVDLAHLICVIH
jgi:hypothetical protein